LRRHAAHGGARARIRGDRGVGLDSGRGRSHHASRCEPENPSHGLEYAQRAAAPSAARRHPARERRAAPLFRALLPSCGRATDPCSRAGRLWRAGDRRGGARDLRGHAVSPGEKPAARPSADRQFPGMGAVILFPAIDLKDGLCVRLEQGDMGRATVFNRDAAAQAHTFEAHGFEYLHVVDLDGAFAGRPMNAGAVDRILEAISIPVQLGGGIRDMTTVEAWLAKGVTRVIIGTAAVRDPAFVRRAAQHFPGRVAVGLDARDGKVAIAGWAETSELSAFDIARRFEDAGVAAIIYTDISRDGLLAGLNLDAAIALADAVSIPVIASGGLASIADVVALLQPCAKKLAGAIAGRALYDGRLDPTEALRLIRTARAAT